MNANELADELDNRRIELSSKITEDVNLAMLFYYKAAILLRQQAQEIKHLTIERELLKAHMRLVASNLRGGLSKMFQKAQARSIEEELEESDLRAKKASEK